MLVVLNQWGGLISLISLIFSGTIFFWTGNIKTNIRKNMEYKTYGKSKKEILRNLQSLISSLEKDDLMDYSFQVELLSEINGLLKCKGFVDFLSRSYIWQLNKITKDGINNYNKQKIVWLIGKLEGRLALDPVKSTED